MTSLFKKNRSKIRTNNRLWYDINDWKTNYRQNLLSNTKVCNANNKYMKNYDKNIEPSYIEYLDANNLYG